MSLGKTGLGRYRDLRGPFVDRGLALWRGVHPENGDPVRLVAVAPGAATAGRAAMDRLAALAEAVKHPNIAPRVERFEHEGQRFDVYLGGEATLGERCAREPMDGPGLVTLAFDLVRAVAHLHGRGLLAVALCPDGIVLGRDGIARLADLRCAMPGGARTFFAQEDVDPRTFAPELFGAAAPDPRSDVYGLGAVLLLAAVGAASFDALMSAGNLAEAELPWQQWYLRHVAPGEPFAALLDAVGESAPPLRPLLARMIRREPSARPRDAVEVLEQLRVALVTDEKAGPRSVFDPQPLPARPARSARLPRAGAVLLAATLVVSAAASVMLGQRPALPAGSRCDEARFRVLSDAIARVPIADGRPVDALAGEMVAAGCPQLAERELAAYDARLDAAPASIGRERLVALRRWVRARRARLEGHSQPIGRAR